MPDFTPAQQVAFKAILDAYTLLTEADIALHKLMEQAAKAKIALEAAMQAGSGSFAQGGRRSMSATMEILRELAVLEKHDLAATRLVLTRRFAQRLKDDIKLDIGLPKLTEIIDKMRENQPLDVMEQQWLPARVGDTGALFGIPFEVVADQPEFSVVTRSSGSPSHEEPHA